MKKYPKYHVIVSFKDNPDPEDFCLIAVFETGGDAAEVAKHLLKVRPSWRVVKVNKVQGKHTSNHCIYSKAIEEFEEQQREKAIELAYHQYAMGKNQPTGKEGQLEKDMSTGEYGAPCDPKRFGE